MTKDERRRRDRAIAFGYNFGDSPLSLAEKHSLTHQAVYLILRAQGIRTKEARAERHKQIKELFSEGMSVIDIAEKVGYKRRNVYRVCAELGIGLQEYGKRKCKICGQMFSAKHYRELCCSVGCKAENKRNTMRNWEKQMCWMVCERCGKRYRTQKGRRSKRKFCSWKCVRKNQHGRKDLIDDEIWYLREIQGLTFTRIGEIFKMHRNSARRIYMEVRLQKQLANRW